MLLPFINVVRKKINKKTDRSRHWRIGDVWQGTDGPARGLPMVHWHPPGTCLQSDAVQVEQLNGDVSSLRAPSLPSIDEGTPTGDGSDHLCSTHHNAWRAVSKRIMILPPAPLRCFIVAPPPLPPKSGTWMLPPTLGTPRVRGAACKEQTHHYLSLSPPPPPCPPRALFLPSSTGPVRW